MADAVCPTDGVPTVRNDVFTRTDEDALVGTLFGGRFRVDSVLGVGGMGKVYRAVQLSMNRPVALKTLLPRLLSEKKHVSRFYREARAASALESPHVVKIYDFGIDDDTGTPFIAMELLRGRSLADAINLEPMMRPKRVARLLAQVCKALREAECVGIVHRDLKPENIYLSSPVGDEEFVKVMDFGIAKVLNDTDSQINLTSTGTTVGTPMYMAPEQSMARVVDNRADLYSVGCMLHELLMGEAPFVADEALEVMMRHVSVPVPPLPELLPSMEQLPPALGVLHQALLQKSPPDRPGDAEVVFRILQAVQRGDEIDAATLVEMSKRGGEVLKFDSEGIATYDRLGSGDDISTSETLGALDVRQLTDGGLVSFSVQEPERDHQATKLGFQGALGRGDKPPAAPEDEPAPDESPALADREPGPTTAVLEKRQSQATVTGPSVSDMSFLTRPRRRRRRVAAVLVLGTALGVAAAYWSPDSAEEPDPTATETAAEIGTDVGTPAPAVAERLAVAPAQPDALPAAVALPTTRRQQAESQRRPSMRTQITPPAAAMVERPAVVGLRQGRRAPAAVVALPVRPAKPRGSAQKAVQVAPPAPVVTPVEPKVKAKPPEDEPTPW